MIRLVILGLGVVIFWIVAVGSGLHELSAVETIVGMVVAVACILLGLSGEGQDLEEGEG